MEWKTTIGLEVHIQLATKSKLFSGSSTNFGALANIQANNIDLALPGVLPVLNQDAVNMAVKFGLAINAQINKKSIFDRKHYFYPDLPKGYQITQLYEPIIKQGSVDIPIDKNKYKTITISHAHLEEDAGKSLHNVFDGHTGIDLNRAGIPLLEVVTEPDFSSATEVISYLKYINNLIVYLGISDGNMSQGSMRCDVNISVCEKDSKQLGVRCEIKNVNSFRFIEKAIAYEVARHIDILEGGKTLTQQTRLYDAIKNETRPMREKETNNDYRYFPDPDLLPVVLTDAAIAAIAATMPEMSTAKKQRFIDDYKITPYVADILVSKLSLANYFEQTIKWGAQAQLASTWIIGDLLGALNKDSLDITASPIDAPSLAELLKQIENKSLSGKMAKEVFSQAWLGKKSMTAIISAQNLHQITDTSAIDDICTSVLADNPEQVKQYISLSTDKRKRLLGFFIGQAMKMSKGRAEPSQVNARLLKQLEKTSSIYA